MSPSSLTPRPLAREISRLATALLAEQLDGEDQNRLDRLVQSSPEAMGYYLEFMQTSYHLHCWAQGNRAASLSTMALPPLLESAALPPRRKWTSLLNYHTYPLTFALVVASISMISIIATLRQFHVAEPAAPQVVKQPAERLPGTTVKATYVRGVGVRWAEPWNNLQPGAKVPAGQTLRLVRGWAEFKFESGARAVIEGPATWRVSNSNACRLALGTLTARVPRSAVGFEVITPVARIIDRGTVFGVRVTIDGATEVHTFEGRVDAGLLDHVVPDSEVLQLVAGEALRFDANRPAWSKHKAESKGFAQQVPEESQSLTLLPVADARIITEQGDSPSPNVECLSVFCMGELRQRCLLKFDLSEIPAGHEIQSAHLRLYRLRDDVARDVGVGAWIRPQMNPRREAMQIFRLTRPWGEESVNWLGPDAHVRWQRAGGDAVGSTGLPLNEPYATADGDPAPGQPVEWDLTALVRLWHQGREENHGLLLISHTGNLLHFYSKEFTDRNLAPQLEILTAAPR